MAPEFESTDAIAVQPFGSQTASQPTPAMYTDSVSGGDGGGGGEGWSGRDGGSSEGDFLVYAHYADEPIGPAPPQLCESDQLMSGIDTTDPAQMETQIAARRQEIAAQVTDQEQQVQTAASGRRAEMQTKSDKDASSPQCVDYPSSNAPKQKAEAKGATIEELHSELTGSFTREMDELNQSLDAAKCDLETRFDAQLDKLERTGSTELDEMDKSQASRNTSLEDYAASQGAQLQQTALRESGNVQAAYDKQNGRQGGHADSEMARLVAEGEKEVENDKKVIDAQIAQARRQADTEAQQAIATGDAQAKSARDAANARAAQIEADPAKSAEATQVRSQGESRSAQAQTQTTQRVRDIEQRRDQTIRELEQRRETEAARLRSQAANRAQRIQAQASATSDKLGSTRDATNSTIAGSERDGAARMNAETSKVANAAGVQRGNMATDIASKRAQLIADKEKGMAKLQKQHDERVKAAQAKVMETERRLATAKPGDVAAMRKVVTGAMRNIDDQSVQAERNQRKAVQQADAAITAKATLQVAQLKAKGRQAIAALDGMARTAKLRMDAHRRTAEREMAGAVRNSRSDMAKIATDAIQAQTTTTNSEITGLKADAMSGREALQVDSEVIVARGQADMDKLEQGLEKEIQTTMRKNAVDEAQKGLKAGGSSDEAIAAMDTLNSLPAGLQKDAITELDGPAFDNMIKTVPENRREEFESLYRAADNDPSRKMKLWKEWHVSKSNRLVDEEVAKVSADPTLTATQIAHRTTMLNSAKASTREEVDALDTWLNGPDGAWAKAGTSKQIQLDNIALLERTKTKEAAIERKYNVNLTNDKGNDFAKITDPATGAVAKANQKPEERAMWKEAELDEVEMALGRLPEANVKDNTEIKEMRRKGMGRKFVKGTDINPATHAAYGQDQWIDRPGLMGSNNETTKVLSMYNAGVSGSDPMLSDASGNQIQSDLSGNGNIYTGSNLTSTLAHEIGHGVERTDKAARDKIVAAAGWQNPPEDKFKADLKKKNPAMSDADIDKQIAAMKANSYKRVVIDGKQYNYNKYDGKLYSFDEGKLPPDTGGKAGTYDYARDNPNDHFAELYAKMSNAPTQAHDDLVKDPADRAQKAKKALQDAQTEADANPGDADKQKKLEEAKAANKTAQDNATALDTQWTTMRNEIFHTNDAQTAADAELRSVATGGKQNARQATLLADFNTKAQRCATPDQIQQLKAEYAKLIAAAK